MIFAYFRLIIDVWDQIYFVTNCHVFIIIIKIIYDDIVKYKHLLRLRIVKDPWTYCNALEL